MSDEDELRALIERLHRVTELTKHRDWNLFEDVLRHEITGWQRRLLGGSIETIEEYKRYAGRVEGAMFVLNLKDSLAQRVEAARAMLEEQRALEADGEE